MFPEAMMNYASSAASRVYILFTSPGSFLSPAPLAVAFLIAGLIVALRLRRRGAEVSIGAVARALFPAHVIKHPSARHDLWIILINEGLLYFLPAIGAIAVGVMRSPIIEITGTGAAMATAPTGNIAMLILFGVYYTLVWDFFATYAHYLKHKLPILWEFHKVHHCAEVLTPLTAMRRHPVEIVISGIITGGGIALALILWVWIFGAPGTTLEIAGVAAGIYAWRFFGYNIRHTHVWISYGPFWNKILMSPAHHQLHHSRESRHYDCNFGHIFSFWDRMFGTLYQPREGESFEFGIENAENEELRTLPALYIRPFQKAAARFLPARAPRPQAAE